MMPFKLISILQSLNFKRLVLNILLIHFIKLTSSIDFIIFIQGNSNKIIYFINKINCIMDMKKYQGSTNQLDEKLDQQFVRLLTNIENRYLIFNRHIQIRIEKWVEKLLHYDQNTVWRKCRNNYINLLHEMVMRQKIQGIFLRMPPEKDIPNLSQSQYRIIFQELKLNSKIEQIKTHQFNIKKVEEPVGDLGSFITTPKCLTDRNYNQNVYIDQIEQQEKTKIKRGNKKKQVQLLEKISSLLERNMNKLSEDKEYFKLVKNLQEIIEHEQDQVDQCFNQGIIQKDYSSELRVQEGIQINKANLFQFGSPRGMTQMQYFRAALQL